ncbi:hypothetical protein CN918_26200 [Priestia megaterium]|nr:hypothetical protein CN918_26200 [Priestia megaterium]
MKISNGYIIYKKCYLILLLLILLFVPSYQTEGADIKNFNMHSFFSFLFVSEHFEVPHVKYSIGIVIVILYLVYKGLTLQKEKNKLLIPTFSFILGLYFFYGFKPLGVELKIGVYFIIVSLLVDFLVHFYNFFLVNNKSIKPIYNIISPFFLAFLAIFMIFYFIHLSDSIYVFINNTPVRGLTLTP